MLLDIPRLPRAVMISTATKHKNKLANGPAAETFNCPERSFWQENKTSLEHKMGLIKTYGLAGVASWRYGFEKPEIWPMLEQKLKELEPAKETDPKPEEAAVQKAAKKEKRHPVGCQVLLR